MATPTKTSLGSRLLEKEIQKRQLSYRAVAEEMSTMGRPVQRYSVWQWAHGISKPSLENSYTLQSWSRGRLPPESWLAKDEGEMKKAQELRRSRRSR